MLRKAVRLTRCHAHAGACNATGHLVNTEDKDCEQCKADLYLFSVVSPAEPGRAVCPEHAALLNGPLKLLYRYEIPASNLGPHDLLCTVGCDASAASCPSRSMCNAGLLRYLCGDKDGRGLAVCRYSMEELEGFVTEAIRCVPGTAEAIADARERRSNPVRPHAV